MQSSFYAELQPIKNLRIKSQFGYIMGASMAVWEDGSALQNFLKGKTKEAVAAYEDNLGKLDWIMVNELKRFI